MAATDCSVMDIAKRHYYVRPDPVGGTFVWADKETPATWSTYRTADSEKNTRKLDEISFEEIRAATLVNSTGDIPVEVARAFGTRRLATDGRSRIEHVGGRAKVLGIIPPRLRTVGRSLGVYWCFEVESKHLKNVGDYLCPELFGMMPAAKSVES